MPTKPITLVGADVERPEGPDFIRNAIQKGDVDHLCVPLRSDPETKKAVKRFMDNRDPAQDQNLLAEAGFNPDSSQADLMKTARAAGIKVSPIGMAITEEQAMQRINGLARDINPKESSGDFAGLPPN